MEVTEQTLKCPICMDFFADPVLLPCGHNFCHTCIRAVWNMDGSKEGQEGPLFCPECQIFLSADLRLEVNADLLQKVQDVTVRGAVSEESPPSNEASGVLCDHCVDRTVVAIKSCLTCSASLCLAHTRAHEQREALRGHTLMEVTEDLLSFRCREHGEELRLFCRDDHAAICSLCVVVGAHRSHRVVRLHEACADLKKVLSANETLLSERSQMIQCVMEDLKPLFSETMSSFETSRKRISEKYNQIKAIIEEDELLLMKILDTEELYTRKWLESKIGSLEDHLRDMNRLLSVCESVNLEKNDLKFVQHINEHGLGKNLQLPPLQKVKKEICSTDKIRTVLEMVERLHQAVFQSTERAWSHLRMITLDTETAHPYLEVSEDRLEVRWSKQHLKGRRETEHLNSQYSVLATESFSTGSHYWEVGVWEKPYWLIGVANGSNFRINMQDIKFPSSDLSQTLSYVYHGNGKYLVCHDSEELPLLVEKQIQKLGVSIDFQKGTLSFYDADTLVLLHSFSVRFLDVVHPIFNPCIAFNDQNKQPVTLINLRCKSETQP